MGLRRLYDRLNAWADRFEKRRLPKWLTYDYWGDPVSWVFSHPAFAACAATIGAGVGAMLAPFVRPPVPGWRLGAVIGALCAALVYTFYRELREALRAYRTQGWAGAWWRLRRNPYPRPEAIQVGWLVDGIGDIVLVWLLFVLLWWVLLGWWPL